MVDLSFTQPIGRANAISRSEIIGREGQQVLPGVKRAATPESIYSHAQSEDFRQCSQEAAPQRLISDQRPRPAKTRARAVRLSQQVRSIDLLILVS